MIKSFFTLICIGLLIISCKSNKHPSAPILKPQKIIRKVNDDVYLSKVKNLQKYRGSFFLDNKNTHQVLKLDSLLNLEKIIGSHGRGPGEFQFPGAIAVNKDSLYVYDSGAMRFNVYNLDGRYIRSFHIPHRLGKTRIAVAHNKLFMSSVAVTDHPSSIFITNLNGKLLKYFNSNSIRNPRLNLTNRFLFTTSDKHYIISVSESEPYVERYSVQGDFLDSFDLREVETLQPLWEHYKKKKSENTQYHRTNLITDAYLDGKFLYICCAGWPGRDDYTYIIKLDVSKNEIKYNSTFKITDKKKYALFNTIVVDGNNLLAMNISRGTLCTFNLSKL